MGQRIQSRYNCLQSLRDNRLSVRRHSGALSKGPPVDNFCAADESLSQLHFVRLRRDGTIFDAQRKLYHPRFVR